MDDMTLAATATVRWVLNEAIDRTFAALRVPEAAGDPPVGSVLCGRYWISHLREAFDRIYCVRSEVAPGRVRTFVGGVDSEIRSNGKPVQEILHDILVAETVMVRSPEGRADIVLIRRPIWQVESEVDASSREVGWDLSKLMVGGATFKLLITSRRDNRCEFDRFLAHATSNSASIFFAAYMPSYASNTRGALSWWPGPRPTFQLSLLSGDKVAKMEDDDGALHDNGQVPIALQPWVGAL
jgi:hypothetical protein